jgi:hypothetical protein
MLAFSLRNFCLFLDQIEDLALDPSEYAEAMADALAIMHWSAGIDANDVEFVLGSLPTKFWGGIASSQIITQSPPLELDFKNLSLEPITTWGVNWQAKDFKTRVTHGFWISIDAKKSIETHQELQKPFELSSQTIHTTLNLALI